MIFCLFLGGLLGLAFLYAGYQPMMWGLR